MLGHQASRQAILSFLLTFLLLLSSDQTWEPYRRRNPKITEANRFSHPARSHGPKPRSVVADINKRYDSLRPPKACDSGKRSY